MASQFGDFIASELFCPKCQRSQPVRQRLLLVLPSGELFDYLCVQCATSLGQRTVTVANPLSAAAQRNRPTRKPRRLLR